jgi:adenosylcobyric acid synthase
MNNPNKPLGKALMVMGCTSSAGKSYLTAAICRILANEGVRVAPFKAQNMSNNAGVTLGGLEMGRAQMVQAVAARVLPNVRMNPVLLKPEADTRSQVVVLGKANLELSRLPWRERKTHLWGTVKTALYSLLEEYQVVVIEGAGSPAEVNLRGSDIVNMAVALEVKASVLLVSDIDRGGSFAHLLGTWQCCSPEERALIKGFILNRFRGDAALLAPAPQWLEGQTQIPTVGVVPMLNIPLPEEDGVTLEGQNGGAGEVAVIALPRISNLDEFAPLGNRMRMVRSPNQLEGAKAIILPGSKSTRADLEWLRETGLAGAVVQQARAGIPILGICGGLQMLGTTIHDPNAIETGLEGAGSSYGLGLLDLSTTFEHGKITRAATFKDLETGATLQGYEIHVGRTTGTAKPSLEREHEVVGWRAGNVRGVYAHGLLENPFFLERFLARAGIAPPQSLEGLDARLDVIAEQVKNALEWEKIRSWVL